jgi:hypothetical protein
MHTLDVRQLLQLSGFIGQDIGVTRDRLDIMYVMMYDLIYVVMYILMYDIMYDLMYALIFVFMFV